VLSAPRERLLRLLDDSAPATACIENNRRAMRFALRDRLDAGPVIASDRELHDYLWFTMAHERVETVHCLFLGATHQLLRDERLSTGTQSEALIAPRDILYRALELQAAGLILVHNHPSGDPTPSSADIAATRALVRAAAPLGITIHDHMIIGATGHASLRGRRLI
jgi:DNA repair protein RadC